MNIWKRYSMRVSKNWVKFNKMFTLSPCYHYRLTTEGVIVTYQDVIPEVAYTIVRGLAWFGLVWLGLAWLGLAWWSVYLQWLYWDHFLWWGLVGWHSLRYFSLTLKVK